MPNFLDEENPAIDYLDDPEDGPVGVNGKPLVPPRIAPPPSITTVPPPTRPVGAGNQPTISEIIAQSQPRLPETSPDQKELSGIVRAAETSHRGIGDVLSRKPVTPEPKWWQRALAGAAGGAAGYVNASGRTHVDPRGAIAAAYDVPGQQRKMEAWQKEYDIAQAADEKAQRDVSTLEKMRQLRTAEQRAASDEQEKLARAQKEREANSFAEKKAQEATAERRDEQLLKLPDAFRVQGEEREKVPTDWILTPSAATPGEFIATPPRFKALPEELVPYVGGKIGDQVPWSTYRAAQAALAKDTIAQNKPEKVKGVDAVNLAIRAAGGDPDNPASITPEIARKASAIIKPPSAAGVGVTLTPEAMDYWAKFAGTTGQMPSLGMGNAGAKAREQILNRAPQVVGGDVASNRAVNRADAGSLAGMQKMRDTVVAFENTANKNLDLFLNRAKPIIDSGSPLINQPLRSIDKRLLGSAELAAYDAARRVAINEVAKVTNNPTLAGQLSDTARKEVEGLVPEEATLAQIYAVVNTLKQDMANRHVELDRGISDIKGRLGGGGRGTPPAAPGPSVTFNGHVYGPFKDQAAADLFKRDQGIK